MQTYADAKIRQILTSVKTIAVVGLSANPSRPSYEVATFLQDKGYRIIPVNPGLAGQQVLGEMAYASLGDIPCKVDMVDIFRPSASVAAIVDEALALGIRILWTQLDIRDDQAAAKAIAAGAEMIMDRCALIEWGRVVRL